MTDYHLLERLPTSEELPDSDGKPVDNELQILIASLLAEILNLHWKARNDWFFGVNMGIYHNTGTDPTIPIVPDGFLSLGVPRYRNKKLRRSYIVWEENQVAPIFVLESVSHTYGKEYDEKMAIYARLGVLYYAIYNPEFYQRDKHTPFEVYQLTQGRYLQRTGQPIYLPEIGLGIGHEPDYYRGLQYEWLFLYDKQGERLSTPTQQIEQAEFEIWLERQRTEQERQRAEQERQRAEQERQRAEQEHQRAEKLADFLRRQGIDPDSLK